jgi:hypothetical protein
MLSLQIATCDSSEPGPPAPIQTQSIGNEKHSIGSAHERKAVKAREWSAWVLPIEFIELSESIAYGY